MNISQHTPFDFSQIQYQNGFANVLTLTNTAKANLLLEVKNQPINIGVDEVGRGCILGPAAVASVILDPNQPIAGLTDSKKLTEKKRIMLFDVICKQALAVNITFVSASKIDEINILQATLTAMGESVTALVNSLSTKQKFVAHDFHVLVDGNQTIKTAFPCTAIVKGDALHPEISAASVVAKVCRDAYMTKMHEQHPNHAINQHKGYPTKIHKQKINEFGILAEHRASFNPIKTMLEQSEMDFQ